MSKVRVAGKQKTITFVYMHTGAKHMLRLAQEAEDGQFYTLISSLVYSAFTLEAYLNHLGKLRNKEWDDVERKYAKLEKYKMFCKAGGISFDLATRPYLTLVELFQFRDQMAHGKTTSEDISVEFEVNEIKLPHLNIANVWQSFATIQRAEEAISDVEQLINELHTASGYQGNPFATSGSGTYGVTKKNA